MVKRLATNRMLSVLVANDALFAVGYICGMRASSSASWALREGL
jgi:hypothetical protein